jgi:hypothetical protein
MILLNGRWKMDDISEDDLNYIKKGEGGKFLLEQTRRDEFLSSLGSLEEGQRERVCVCVSPNSSSFTK